MPPFDRCGPRNRPQRGRDTPVASQKNLPPISSCPALSLLLNPRALPPPINRSATGTGPVRPSNPSSRVASTRGALQAQTPANSQHNNTPIHPNLHFQNHANREPLTHPATAPLRGQSPSGPLSEPRQTKGRMKHHGIGHGNAARISLILSSSASISIVAVFQTVNQFVFM